ncbi:MAG: aminomethyl-transferring glycine dehydrogenase subunit GcvPB, partial [Geminicoccaceae bacterium]
MMAELTLYELSVPGRKGVDLPGCDMPKTPLPETLIRDDNGLPELSELDVVRHFQRLSQRNFGVDSGFYPLGSCTMKYNPRINEAVAALPGLAEAHPLADEADVQGCPAIMHELQTWLAEIGGFTATSLQPSAGAHGELTALLMMRQYHADRGDERRIHVLIPDSAHGTNPASTVMAGLTALEIPSDERGNIDLEALAVACDETVVGLMLTNPNTLGLFEERVEDVVRLVHDCGGLVYGDGANMNALTGIARPGDLGIDLMHYNLHKTFATPHGGGGPGAGPLAASATLAPYLPDPIVEKQSVDADASVSFHWFAPEKSIGRVSTFGGNFGMILRAYVYILMHGAVGLRQNAVNAVLNANYLRVRLREVYSVPFDRMAMHEFVCQGKISGSKVHATDISKRLMDFGIHPPTNYFPLIVREALMIEPTETESKPTLDAFIDAMLQIAEEA